MNLPIIYLLKLHLAHITISEYCKISYTASLLTSPDPFEFKTGTSGTTTTVANCQLTYLGIPQGGDTGNMDSRANRYCGAYCDSSEGATRNGQVTCKSSFIHLKGLLLSHFSASVAPFDVFVFSDASPVTSDKSPTISSTQKKTLMCTK